MSKVVIDRAVVEQVLEAWDGGDIEWFKRAYIVMENLRTALAQEPPELDDPERRCGGPGCDESRCQLVAQQDEPVQEPAYKVEIAGRWHDAEPLPPAFSLPDGEHLLYTAPRKAEPVLQALQNLVSVCQRMDLKHQAAMQAAKAAIQAVDGAA